MARIARTLIVAAAFVAAAVPGSAQALQRLAVRSMVLSVDTPRVRLRDMVRLTLRVQLAGHVARLDNVTLGDVSGFDVLGDERRCVAVRNATDCTETLSLAPTRPGRYVLGPITLDATDARTLRATRFGSNSVMVVVAPDVPAFVGGNLLALAASVARAAGVALILVVAGIGVILLLRRRPRRAAPVVEVAEPPVPRPPPPDADERWRLMLERLRARPSRGRIAALRAVLRERVGARPDETFSDLAARGMQFEEPSSMEALRLLERAAFVDDAHLQDAVVDALPALQAVAGMRRVG